VNEDRVNPDQRTELAKTYLAVSFSEKKPAHRSKARSRDTNKNRSTYSLRSVLIVEARVKTECEELKRRKGEKNSREKTEIGLTGPSPEFRRNSPENCHSFYP
jgi:hypothetical protein